MRLILMLNIVKNALYPLKLLLALRHEEDLVSSVFQRVKTILKHLEILIERRLFGSVEPHDFFP